MAALKEWTDREARHREVRRVLGLVGLSDLAGKRMRTLSGGQRRRAALAQALIGSPDLLVLDEPTTGLDPEQRASLRGVLSGAGHRSTMLLATHQTEDVAALCERVIVLDDGRVLWDGSVTDLVATATGKVWLADERGPDGTVLVADRHRPPSPRRPRPAGRRRDQPSRASRTPTCCCGPRPAATSGRCRHDRRGRISGAGARPPTSAGHSGRSPATSRCVWSGTRSSSSQR